MAEPAGLFRSTRTVMIGRALGLLAAFAFFWIMAKKYGTSAATDAYFSAYAIPYAILVIVGATLSQSFIPLHAEVVKSDGDESAARFSSSCLNLTFIVMAVLAGIGVLAAPLLARLAATDKPDVPVTEIARQMRWLLPLVVFGGAANLAKGILNARFVFFTPSLDTFASYASTIATILIFAPKWGIGALVIGTVVGNVFRFLVMVPDLIRVGWKPVLHHPMTRFWVLSIFPLAGGSIFLGANIVLIRHLASLLPVKNAVSYLGYAERLVMVPSELIAASIGVAVLPSAAAYFARGERGEFAKLMSRSIRWTLLLLVPAGAGLMALARPVVDLVYGRGAAFNAESTAQTLFWFSTILPGSILLITGQAFFAMNRGKLIILMWIGLVAGTFLYSLALMSGMMHNGIVLGFSLSNWTVALISLFMIKRLEPAFPLGEIATSFLRMLVAAAAMGFAVWKIDAILESHGLIFRLIAGAGAGALLYATLLSILRSPEVAGFCIPTVLVLALLGSLVCNFQPMATAGLLAIALLLSLGTARRIPREWLLLLLPFGWWAISFALSGVSWSVFFSPEFQRRDGAIYFSLMPIALCILPLDAKWMERGILAYLGVHVALTVAGIASACFGWISAIYHPAEVVDNGLTYFGLYVAHNATSSVYCLLTAVALVMALRDKSKWLLAASLILGVGLMLARSRGAALALAITVAFVIFRARKEAPKGFLAASLAGFLVVGIIGAIVMMPRLQALKTDTQATELRLGYWPRAWNDFKSSPVVGIGFGKFNDVDGIRNDDKHAHNSYLHWLAEGGLIGLGVMIAFWVLVARKSSAVVLAGIVAMAVLSLTEHYAGGGIFLTHLALLIGIERALSSNRS